MRKIFLLSVILITLCLYLSSCDESSKLDKEYFTVTFEENGGCEVEDIFICGETELPTVTRYHYIFEGWYADEDFSGDPIEKIDPTKDVTLYAKWTRCSYLYAYYNDGYDYFRYEYLDGEVINIDYLELPPEYSVDGVICPFINWEYETGEVANGIISIGNEDIIIVAKYDKSNVQNKTYIVEKSENTYTNTGSQAWSVGCSTFNDYVISADFLVKKGASGGVGLFFNGTVGKIIDVDFKDANDFGRVMAPAAIDTYINHMKDLNLKDDYYDLVVTGDLSSIGSEL